MHNLEPHEAYLIYELINDRDYLTRWNTIKDTFTSRSITTTRSLRILVKDSEAIDDFIISIGITINDTPLHQLIFTSMSIKVCEYIFDGTQQDIGY